jgi:hypothetical protein
MEKYIEILAIACYNDYKKGGDYVSDLRYNRAFKKGLAAILFCIILFSSVVVFFIVSTVQYNHLVSDMKSLEATIVDIDFDVHVRGPDEQEIYIEYVVDGIVYSRELKTDTAISFAAGTGAHYSVGDKIQIFYDPQNPEVIASPRSIGVGVFCAVVGLSGLALVVFSLIAVLKTRRRFLVTQEEYEKEGKELKRSKLAEKQQKKQAKLERKNRHPKARKVGRVILIALGCLIGAFILYLLFGLLLISLGY